MNRICSSDDSAAEHIASAAKAVTIAARCGQWHLVKKSLHHRLADVRKESLVCLAQQSSGALPEELLALSSDKGYRVRQALLKIMQERPHRDHVPAILKLAADTWTSSPVHYGEESHFPIAKDAAELLGKPPLIDDSDVSAIGNIALETKDEDVKRALFNALIVNGSEDACHRVLKFALRTGRPPNHKIAAEALFQHCEKLNETLVSEIKDEDLVSRAASISCLLALLIGACAAPERVTSAAKMLAAKVDRRALLIPLLIAAAGREHVALEEIAALLPADLVADLFSAIDGDSKLERNRIDNLGDVRTLEAIRGRLGFLFAS